METLQFEVLNTDSSLVTERALCKFENGFGASVLRGHGSLTTATAPYELAIVKFYDDINVSIRSSTYSLLQSESHKEKQGCTVIGASLFCRYLIC